MSGGNCSYWMREKYRIYTMVRNRDNAEFPKVIVTEINIKQNIARSNLSQTLKVCWNTNRLIPSFHCNHIDIDVLVEPDPWNKFRMLFEGTDVQQGTSELTWNEISASCDGIADTCVDRWYIGKHQHWYRGRSTRFGFNVEVSGWAVIVKFGA